MFARLPNMPPFNCFLCTSSEVAVQWCFFGITLLKTFAKKKVSRRPQHMDSSLSKPAVLDLQLPLKGCPLQFLPFELCEISQNSFLLHHSYFNGFY